MMLSRVLTRKSSGYTLGCCDLICTPLNFWGIFCNIVLIRSGQANARLQTKYWEVMCPVARNSINARFAMHSGGSACMSNCLRNGKRTPWKEKRKRKLGAMRCLTRNCKRGLLGRRRMTCPPIPVADRPECVAACSGRMARRGMARGFVTAFDAFAIECV